MMDGHTFRRLIGGLAMVCACASLAPAADEGKLPLPALDPALRQELNAWLDSNGTDPVSYVLRLFRTHDVVILGEGHSIRNHQVFVRSLIEPLHRAGIRVLATEFARRIDQPLADSLVTAPNWDEDRAREIIFRQEGGATWGFQEYVDIYRAAWELNRKLPADTRPFRILGVNDAPDWSYIRTATDIRRDDVQLGLKIWNSRDFSGENYWASRILREVDAGEKVLVHCGMHHAFTRYKQPWVRDGKFVHYTEVRMGNYLYHWLGDRVVTVALHQPWPPPGGYGSGKVGYAANGAIDAVMLDREGRPRAIGFDIVGGPYGRIEPQETYYRHGHSSFRLSDYCDGWIYFCPLSEYEPATPIENWVNESNIERARVSSGSISERTWSTEQFNETVRTKFRLIWMAHLR